MGRLALTLALITAAAPALACAVATRVEVENRSGRPLSAVFVEAGTVANQLPREGLRPGGTATITLPSCLGTYSVVAEYADGTRVRHTGLNARSIRTLTIR